MLNLNMVTLRGQLTQDPSISEPKTGLRIGRFKVATNVPAWKASGEAYNDSQVHEVITWDSNIVHILRTLKQGQEVTVKGRIAYRKYTTTGTNPHTVYITEIIASEMIHHV